MNKTIKFIAGAIVAITVIVTIILTAISRNENKETTKTNLPETATVEDLTSLVDKVYEGVTQEMPMLQTVAIDLTDSASFTSFTGLESSENIEYAVVSEPPISSIPYSLVIAKVKSGVNANEIAKQISENVNPRKWICVSAKKIYSTNSGDIVFFVMGNTDLAKEVYNSFKALAGTVGKEYEKTQEEEELPPDTTEDFQIEVPDGNATQKEENALNGEKNNNISTENESIVQSMDGELTPSTQSTSTMQTEE